MNFTLERVNAMLESLKPLCLSHHVPLTGFLYKTCGYKQGSTLPSADESWEIIDGLRLWGSEKDSHAWFYKKIEIPQAMRGQSVDLCVTTGVEGQWDATNPQFLIYVNGSAIQGLDVNHTRVTLPEGDSMEVYLYAYAGMQGAPVRFCAALEVDDALITKLYYHLYVPRSILQYLEPDSSTYIDISTQLNKAIDLIDVRTIGSCQSIASIQAAIDHLEAELYTGAGVDGAVISCIGHTHIDMAWLWTLDQTKEKVQRSFANVLRLMDAYPEFVFMSSQAHLYQYLKDESPELYAQVKQRIAEGRWEVEGAMWVEADCNLTSGESLVRQLVYGKRFFRREFGVESRVLWLPDVFGYTAALPQLLKQCGVDSFVTSKISWNEQNKMPFDTFDWQGIDGTRVFTYFLTAQDKVRGRKPVTMTTYNATAEPSQITGTWERFQQKNISKNVLLTFGYGDGGGGPSRHELELLRRSSKGLAGCPMTSIEPAGVFLDRLRSQTEGLRPRWVGELYLELHRGTYTANAKNKKNNRVSELLLQNAELQSVCVHLLAGTSYPRDILYDHWINLLLHQFHDIIPGSSIGAVYDDSDVMYDKLIYSCRNMELECYQTIAENICTEGGWLVFNPHSFAADGIISTEQGKRFVTGIPPKGYRVVELIPVMSSIVITDSVLENNFFVIKLDETGAITSLLDKRVNRQVLSGRGNVLEAYEDIPKAFDAWEITSYYRRKRWEINDVKAAIPVEDGARRGLCIEKRFEDSVIRQTIWLYDDIPQIDFETNIDWQQSHILLKAAFPIAVNATKATYEIQFGTVERPTHSNTSWDEAMFEVCAHRFADLSEYGYGVSLLNDCKYGHDIHDGVMRLTLLTSSTDPYPEADKHHHSFTYSLCPHIGDYRQTGIAQLAALLNKPLAAQYVSKQEGSWPDQWSLVGADHPAVVIDTVKLAEDSGDVVLRLYESHGSLVNTTLEFGFDIHQASLCDIMEVNDVMIPLRNNRLSVCLKPYEVVTIKLVRA